MMRLPVFNVKTQVGLTGLCRNRIMCLYFHKVRELCIAVTKPRAQIGCTAIKQLMCSNVREHVKIFLNDYSERQSSYLLCNNML